MIAVLKELAAMIRRLGWRGTWRELQAQLREETAPSQSPGSREAGTSGHAARRRL